MNRRVAAVAVAVAVVFAAACTSADTPAIGDGGTPPAGSADSTSPTSVGTTTTVSTTGRTIIVGGTEAVPEGNPTIGAGNPGDAATRLLRPSGAARLVVQIHAQDGAEPPAAALDHVRRVLADASGKTVTVVGGDEPARRQEWTSDDLRRAAAAGARPSSPTEGTIHLLFLHGESDRGDDTLGLAVASDVAAVFTDRISDAAMGLSPPSALMDAVTMHELGHLLGLVDLVLRTGRADPEHPGHSKNASSVMYWAVESSLIGDLLTGGPPREFDDRDRADLATIRDG